MNNYEFLNENLRLVTKLINNGIINMDVIENIQIYEEFHALTGKKMDRYEVLAERFDKSVITIRRIINLMEKRLR